MAKETDTAAVESTRGAGAGGSGGGASRFNFFTIFLVIACGVLAVQVFFLASENRRLKAELGAMPAQRDPGLDLKPGDTLGALTLIDEQGRVERLGAEGRPTLAFLYSDTCGVCDMIKPAWRRLADQLDGDALRAIAISLDMEAEPADHATDPPPAPVHRVRDVVTELLPSIRMVPATVLLDSRGEVLHVWWGLLTDEQEGAALQAALAAADPE
ncbi:MAG: hypothetical protein EA376_14565 [Phycisphaeraceae bacterium]|nr:MAG: hypothetical protein EA376_14565 [Phycisphaeraceae bacterium]